MKLRKLLLTVFAVLFIGWGSALGQEDESKSPVSIEQINSPGIEHNEAVKSFGLDYLMSVDFSSLVQDPARDGNVATISQYGDNNEAVLKQVGSGNTGYIQMGTSDNFVSGNKAFVSQKGNGLISLVNMQGNSNYLDFLQTGNNKGALLYFKGDDMHYNANQTGMGLQLTPTSFNSTGPQINITTTKQTLPVIISRN